MLSILVVWDIKIINFSLSFSASVENCLKYPVNDCIVVFEWGKLGLARYFQ